MYRQQPRPGCPHCLPASADHLDPGDRHDEASILEACDLTDRCQNLAFQVPGQYQYVVGPGFDQFVRMQNRDMGTGRVLPLLVRIAVDREIEEVSADAAVVEQGVALARSAVADDALPGALRTDEKLQQRALGFPDLLGERRVGIERRKTEP